VAKVKAAFSPESQSQKKKQAYTCSIHAGLSDSNEKIRLSLKEQTMQFSEVSIVTPTALCPDAGGSNAPVKKQVRIKRGEIACNAKSGNAGTGPSCCALPEKGRSVRILPCAGASGGQCCARLN
jgi:hypothetical protein